ncbi:MAG: Denitrification regulatory protein NirQ [Promethearchaeota archaeon]|nr:MAG: Denitrification regulatory protein NirQ [Candidatus Lokiarchaeota archaeon]
MAVKNQTKTVSYIQQVDEFDYLKSLINSVEKGNCFGILLYGPPGSGKTLLATSLSNSFHSRYFMVDGSPDLDRRDLEGNWELINGDTRFNYGPLTMAIKDANENGIAFIIINEINAIRESEQISLNSLLSESEINLISKGFEKHKLSPNSKLIIIGTMNKGVVGINKLQEAFEDRFIVCPEINYPNKEKEIEITKKISNCKEGVAEIAVDAARQIRKQATEDYAISKIFSTRLIVNFCYLISKMSPKYLKRNIENVIINKLGETVEERKSIAMILDGKMFEEKLRNALIGKEIQKKNLKESKQKEPDLKIPNDLKEGISYYKKRFGKSSIYRKNGEIMWKFLNWLWKFYRREFKEYIKFTKKMDFYQQYQKQTNKNPMGREGITLRYIKWVYRNKNVDLGIFMRQICPIL